MAQQFYIDNGTNINAAWEAHIAVSYDGVAWTPIAKAGIDVLPVVRTVSVNNPSNPLTQKEKRCYIELKRGGDDTPVVSFDVDNVANQAGWTSGSTVGDRCIAAIADITTWLGTCCSGSSTAGLATESTLNMVLAAIQDGQDFESKLVVDDNGNGDTYLEVRIWNPDTQTWEAPLYYTAGSNTGVPAGSLVAPIIYINNGALLNTIASNTTGLALESTLSAINAKLNSLGQKTSANSVPVVLSSEQQALIDGIEALLTTIDADTSNLDVALSTRATEATLLATNTLLTTIDTVLDNILLDTTSIDTEVTGLNTPTTGLAVSLTRVTGAGAASVAAGKRRVSFFNAGNNNATVAGTTLEKGESVTFSADGLRDTLASISYDALTSELLISTVG